MMNSNLRGVVALDAIIEKVDLRSADLRNAKLERVSLCDSQMENVRVNNGTDLNNAEFDGAKGELNFEGIEGTSEKISIEKKIKSDNKIQDAIKKGGMAKWLGHVSRGIGNNVKKIANFIIQPLGEKWGRFFGAIAGAVIIGAMVINNEMRLEVNIEVITAIIAIFIGAGIGGTFGYYFSKYAGLSVYIGGILGSAFVPGIGAIAGVGLVVGVDQFIRVIIDLSIDEILGVWVDSIGNGLNHDGDKVGLSSEQEELLDSYIISNETYLVPERDDSVGRKAFDKGIKKQQRIMLSQSEELQSLIMKSTSYEMDKVNKQAVKKTNFSSNTLKEEAKQVGSKIGDLVNNPDSWEDDLLD